MTVPFREITQHIKKIKIKEKKGEWMGAIISGEEATFRSRNE